MKSTLTKLAAAGALMVSATAAFAGSITQPGETVGLAAGAPLPPGFYFLTTTDWGVRDVGGPVGKVGVGVTIPVIAWSTPWKVLGARLIFAAAAPAVEVGVTGPLGASYAEGMYNPAALARLAWDLGGGLGFSYSLGGYARVGTTVSHDSNTVFNAFALSYTADGWNLTGNLIWGINDKLVSTTVNPDYVNLDLTATKKFGKWELGAVGFYSTDLQDAPLPFGGIGKQSQFALGGLVGYNFGEVILQTYLTRDVWEKNYGLPGGNSALDTRIWSRIILPLGDPFASPQSSMMYRK